MLTLADGRNRVEYSLTMPAGYNIGDGPLTIQAADFTNLTDDLNRAAFRMSAVGSDTVPDAPLSFAGNATTFGASNLEGSLEILRQLDADGKPDPATDTAFAAFGTKGVRAWFAHRVGRRGTVPLEEGDEGWLYEAVTDEPQEPTEYAGYVKNPVPLGMQSRRRFVVGAPA